MAEPDQYFTVVTMVPREDLIKARTAQSAADMASVLHQGWAKVGQPATEVHPYVLRVDPA